DNHAATPQFYPLSLHDALPILAWECDGYTLERHPPEAVVLPASTEEVSRVMRLLHQAQVPVIPRGAGTSLSGATMPVGGGVVVRSEEHTSELQSRENLVCRRLL